MLKRKSRLAPEFLRLRNSPAVNKPRLMLSGDLLIEAVPVTFTALLFAARCAYFTIYIRRFVIIFLLLIVITARFLFDPSTQLSLSVAINFSSIVVELQ